jgi:ketosteroid isomerase-like protein
MLLLAATLAACVSKTTPEPNDVSSTQWDITAAAEARAVVEQGVRAFESSDLEGVKAVLAESWTTPAYDTDFENKPLRMATQADVIKYAEDTFAEVKKMGATLKIAVKDIACRATSTLAFCVIDHEVTATMANGQSAVQPQQATFVLAKAPAGWKWVHFHSSPGRTPAAPASN